MQIVDIVITSIFGLEFLLKIVTFGFVLNGRASYLRNPWNMLDFIILAMSVISLTPLPNAFSMFKIFRTIRPVRLISRNEGLKVAVLSLIQAVPNIINVSLITLLFFLIFGIISVSYFKGALYSCDSTGIANFDDSAVVTKWDCLNGGAAWLNAFYAFDNILVALRTLF